MAFASASDLVKRYDVRRIGQLVYDDGTKASPAQVAADENVQAALDDADGFIRSAVRRGERYSDDDLSGLAGTAQAFLVRLCCDLAYGLLCERRGNLTPDGVPPGYARAMQTLDLLANGERVLEVDAALAAGKPKRAVLSYDRQLLSETRRLFGNLRLRDGNPGDPPDRGE
jgi:phage gp36-like protein